MKRFLTAVILNCLVAFQGLASAEELPGEFVNSAGIRMIRVEKGEIRELETIKEGEFKEIVITEPYALAAMETTIEQWLVLVKENPDNRDGSNRVRKKPGHPVGGVEFEEAEAYCRKLTELERQKGTLPDGYVYKLPTEEMWEYACRAGTKGGFSLPVETIANHYWPGKDNADIKTEKDLKPNPWGFHHMNGNLEEWCRPGADKIGKLETFLDRGLQYPQRGGCVRSVAESCRSGDRRFGAPDPGQPMYGFRVALVKESTD